MSNGRWRIFRGGWGIKWRTGSSASINGGCDSAGDSAPCRTPLFVHLQERRQLLATPILMCLLKWMRRTQGTSENVQKKRLMLYRRDKIAARCGAVPGNQIFHWQQRADTTMAGGIISRWGGGFRQPERWPYGIFMSSCKRTHELELVLCGDFFLTSVSD